jgi:hypothetical protein
MTRVHTAFSHLAGTEAVAFSEPLCRTEEFQMYQDGQFEDIYRPLGSVAAIGAAHSDGNGIAFNFALSANNNYPFATAKTFVDGYHAVVSGLRSRAFGDPYKLYDSDRAKNMAMEVTALHGLKTIAAFLLFNPEYKDVSDNLLIVPRNVIAETGHALGASDARLKARGRNTPQQAARQAGFLVAMAQLPPFAGVREVVSTYPEVAGLLHLPRGERRKLIRTEANTVKKNKK